MSSLLIGQNRFLGEKRDLIDELIDSLWVNPTSFFNNEDNNWKLLCRSLKDVDSNRMKQITHSIYTDSLRGEINKIENRSTAFNGLIGRLNKKSNRKKLRKYTRKADSVFTNKKRYPENKIVMIEGDSWFQYPLFLKDVSDHLEKRKKIAVYSLAAGGDWMANMISGFEYKTKYKKINPDVFIISGGGNDMLGNKGVTRFVNREPIHSQSPFLNDYKEYVILRMSHKPVPLCNESFCPPSYHDYTDSLKTLQSNLDSIQIEKIVEGRRYVNKNFYKFLVSIKLEYKILFESLYKLNPSHFDSLKIITQGYDYAIPNSSQKIGVRLLLPNGKWLDGPLESIGIRDQEIKESIVMAMMFDFNEMLIELGKEYPNIYHVDVRGFIRHMEYTNKKKKGRYWFDEIHPKNYIFKKIAEVYSTIIEDKAEKDVRVFRMIDYAPN